MVRIYLSPHLDDAALSCKGSIKQQTQAGERVEVWTVCAGEPPDGPLSMFSRKCCISVGGFSAISGW